MTTKDGTDVMTPAEAAKYLKVSIKAVCRMPGPRNFRIWIGNRARFSKTSGTRSGKGEPGSR